MPSTVKMTNNENNDGDHQIAAITFRLDANSINFIRQCATISAHGCSCTLCGILTFNSSSRFEFENKRRNVAHDDALFSARIPKYILFRTFSEFLEPRQHQRFPFPVASIVTIVFLAGHEASSQQQTAPHP